MRDRYRNTNQVSMVHTAGRIQGLSSLFCLGEWLCTEIAEEWRNVRKPEFPSSFQVGKVKEGSQASLRDVPRGTVLKRTSNLGLPVHKTSHRSASPFETPVNFAVLALMIDSHLPPSRVMVRLGRKLPELGLGGSTPMNNLRSVPVGQRNRCRCSSVPWETQSFGLLPTQLLCSKKTLLLLYFPNHCCVWESMYHVCGLHAMVPCGCQRAALCSPLLPPSREFPGLVAGWHGQCPYSLNHLSGAKLWVIRELFVCLFCKCYYKKWEIINPNNLYISKKFPVLMVLLALTVQCQHHPALLRDQELTDFSAGRRLGRGGVITR